MKITILSLLGASAVFLAGCETDMPPEPGKPAVSFATGQARDDAFDRGRPVSTPLEPEAR
jgi:hypothetical protein